MIIWCLNLENLEWSKVLQKETDIIDLVIQDQFINIKYIFLEEEQKMKMGFHFKVLKYFQ